MFQKESVKVEVCKNIMEVFVKWVPIDFSSFSLCSNLLLFEFIPLTWKFLKAIEIFSFRYQEEPTNDPVIINAIMFICKTMHDSVK